MKGKALGIRLLALGLVFPMVGNAADLVGAYRPGIAVTETPWPSLLKATWTNSTTWLTGQINSNEMVDYSPSRTNAVIESLCPVFNGAGDYVSIPIGSAPTLAAGPFTVSADVQYSTNGYFTLCGGVSLYSGGIAIVGYDFSSLFRIAVRGEGADGSTYAQGVQYDAGFAAYADGGVHKISVKIETNQFTVTIDGNQFPSEPIDEGNDSTPVLGTNTTVQLIGRHQNGALGNEYHAGKLFNFKIEQNGVVVEHWPVTEGSGTTIHDVSGNGNHGTAITSSEAEFWGGTQTNSPYAAEYGSVEWTDGTNTVYVPMLSDKITPATNDVSGMSVVQTNFAGYAHNAGPYSLIFGGATNTYANLLTNTTDNITVSTNAAGLIESLYETN